MNLLLRSAVTILLAANILLPQNPERLTRGELTVSSRRPEPRSLQEMTDGSLLIVDGTVTDVFPWVSANPNPDVQLAQRYTSVKVSQILVDRLDAKPTSLFVVQTRSVSG